MLFAFDSFVPLLCRIQVYDIESGIWSTMGDLPEALQTSDLTGFAWKDTAYFLGGYDVDYTAKPTLFSFDTTSSNVSLEAIVQLAPMHVARGDHASAVDPESGVVLVSGGFTHEDTFCEAVATTEVFNITSNVWSKEETVQEVARADSVLVYLDDEFFYELGGETVLEGICDIDIQPNPHELTVLVESVERFNTIQGEWETLTDIDTDRFRFPAVVVGQVIYSFGGQLSYNQICDCYPTSNAIVVYEIVDDESTSPTAAPTSEPADRLPVGEFILQVFVLRKLKGFMVLAGMLSEISGDGPFTIFTPWDFGFQKLDKGLVENLQNRSGAWIPHLQSLLRFHIFDGDVPIDSWESERTLTMKNGEDIIMSRTPVGVVK